MLRISLSIFSVSYNLIIYLAYNSRFRQTAISVVCCCLDNKVVRSNRVGIRPTDGTDYLDTESRNVYSIATPNDRWVMVLQLRTICGSILSLKCRLNSWHDIVYGPRSKIGAKSRCAQKLCNPILTKSQLGTQARFFVYVCTSQNCIDIYTGLHTKTLYLLYGMFALFTFNPICFFERFYDC